MADDLPILRPETTPVKTISATGRCVTAVLLAACVLLPLQLSYGQSSWSSISPESDPVVQHVRAGDYARAMSAIEQRLRFARGEDRIVLLFQQGDIAESYQRDTAAAVRAYNEIVRVAAGTDDADLARVYLARIHARQGDYDHAIDVYTEIVESAPEGSRYRKSAMDAIGRLRRASEEIAAYRRQAAKTTDPIVWAQATFNVATLYDDAGTPDAAVREFAALVRQRPESELAPEAQYRIGQILARQRNTQGALEAYQRVVTQFRASRFDAEALFQTGHLYLNMPDNAAALSAFDRVLTEYPSFWKTSATIYLRAVALERLGRVDDAADAFRLFLNLALLSGERIAMGDIARREDEAAGLQAEIETKLRQIAEGTPARLLNEARSLTAQRKHSEALSTLNRLITDHRSSPEANEALSLVRQYRARSEIQRVLLVADRAEDAPTQARARFQAAGLYERELQDYDAAINLYLLVANSDDSGSTWDAIALYRAGALYVANQGNTSRGLSTFQRLVQLVPSSHESARAYYQIGEILSAEHRNVDGAIAAFQRAIQMPQLSVYLTDGCEDSTADAAAFRVARVLFETRGNAAQSSQAMLNFIRERQRSPRIAAAWLYLSRVYEEIGQRERAIDALLHAKSSADESAVNAQWVRYEFPELGSKNRDELLAWMDRRLDTLQQRKPQSAAATRNSLLPR
ncbi:tetratricopeptide repeat protein [Candidatus Poribacteria bacterium]|nr:tetratricopeptide repeat protein [Candidatus Poribacteria bacterium]